MTWQDRITEGAYRSPNGTRLTFIYEDVSRSVEKKTTAFNFPDTDGTLVQDLGRKGRRYPLRLIFSGDDHDTEADTFEALLLEPGAGVLEHPRYGQVDVVPFGKIAQRDNLKTQANQTVIEVTFFETIGTAYPAAQDDGAQQALAAVASYQDISSEELETAVTFDTQLEEVTLRDQWSDFLDTAESVLSDLENPGDLGTVYDSINNSIDILIAKPLTLARQTQNMVNAPAREVALISDRLEGYGNIAESIISGSSNRISTLSSGGQGIIEATNDNRAVNELYGRQLFAQAAVAGSVTSAMVASQNGGFKTQSGAISAAETLLDLMDTVRDWSETNFSALNNPGTSGILAIDTGGGYQSLLDAVALAAGELIRASFGLKRERNITLTYPRSLYDVVGEYYDDIDASLDFFINSNDLSGDEILELPKGRAVVVYV